MHVFPFMKLLFSGSRTVLSKTLCSSAIQYNLPSISEDAGKGLNEENCLEKLSEDVSAVTPYFRRSFNLAAYVNNSEILKNFVHLNVNLNKIEKKPHIVEKILRLDFEHNIKNHISFLHNYVAMQEIGDFITKNPMILCEPLEDLEVRVNYLHSKHFSNSQIERIISKNPFWLMYSTLRIDKRLGHFQEYFNLTGSDVRFLATKQPKLITYNLHHVKINAFAIKEEFGFEDNEVKQLILAKPKILMINHKTLKERFNYLHNVMKIPHTILLQYPVALFCRNFKIKQRHLFLKNMGRAQYDPRKENYISLKALIEDTDTEFCKIYAKCTVHDYNIFLKTL